MVKKKVIAQGDEAKVLFVSPEHHKKAKVTSAKRELSLRLYVEKLIDDDKNNN